MAIVVRLRVPGASQEDHDRVQEEVNARLAAAGAPPDGLFVHLGYPDGDDLVLVEAWRSPDGFEAYLADVLAPALAAAGLQALPPEVSTAFSIARL